MRTPPRGAVALALALAFALSGCFLVDDFSKVAGPYRRGVWYLIDAGSQAQACSGPAVGHFRYIVIQWYMAVDPDCGLAQIKAANPDAKILAYQNLGAMIGGPHANERPTSGVTQEEATAHEDSAPTDSWFLHDASGDPLFYPTYTALAPANPGRASFMTQWTHHIAAIAEDGFDGILADNVNVIPGYTLGECCGATIAEYPTDAAYGDAMVDAMGVLGPAVESQGLLFVSNVGVNPWNSSERARALLVSDASSGFMRAFWMRWDDDDANLSDAEWEANATLLADVESQGQFFLASTFSGPSPAGAHADAQYAAASFWLMWDGQADSGWGMQRTAFIEDDWGPDIGAPTDAERIPEGAGWLRHYSAGIAIVNPGAGSTQQFDFDEPHRTPDGEVVMSVSLPPAHGMVLVRPE